MQVSAAAFGYLSQEGYTREAQVPRGTLAGDGGE